MIRALSIVAIAGLGGIASGPSSLMNSAGTMGPVSQLEPLCGPHTDVAAGLHEAYDENVVAQGLTSAGVLIEVYASGTGTWTLTVVSPNGVSCLISHGEGWRQSSPAMGVSLPGTGAARPQSDI
ncbi:MAG: hypothetical protein U1F33_14690 [Alphaproteobacteria bacterium]